VSINDMTRHKYIKARIDELSGLYNAVAMRMATLVVSDMAVTAQDLYGEEARWIGLEVNEEGIHPGSLMVSCVLTGDLEHIVDSGDDFNDTYVSDLNDDTAPAWGGYALTREAMGLANSARPDNLPAGDFFLNIHLAVDELVPPEAS
jgi:hypothetical protein